MKTFIVFTLLVGLASAYAPGKMEQARANHQRIDHLGARPSNLDGLVTLADCGLLDAVVLMRTPGTEWKRFWVVDCASKTDRQSETDDRSGYEWMATEGIVAELQWKTWEAFKAADPDLSDGVQIEILVPKQMWGRVLPQ